MKIGILALQGAVQPHREKLADLGITVMAVRREGHLEGLAGVILPGGESTTFIHLLKLNQLWEPLRRFAKERPVWGICAGAILLAKDVQQPAQTSFRLMDIRLNRNAYGRQIDSFATMLEMTPEGKAQLGNESIEGVFIRAPKIMSHGPTVRPLLMCKGDVVAAEQENLLVSTFHPELTQQNALHQFFIEKCHGSRLS